MKTTINEYKTEEKIKRGTPHPLNPNLFFYTKYKVYRRKDTEQMWKYTWVCGNILEEYRQHNHKRNNDNVVYMVENIHTNQFYFGSTNRPYFRKASHQTLIDKAGSGRKDRYAKAISQSYKNGTSNGWRFEVIEEFTNKEDSVRHEKSLIEFHMGINSELILNTKK